MLRKVFTHSLIYAIAPQLPRVVALLILPFLTRHLTTTDYGISATVSVYIGLFSGIKDLGITVLLVNAFYHSPKTWMLRWRIYYGYLLAWAPVLGIMNFLMVWFIIPPEATENRFLICLLTSVPVLLFDHTVLIGFRYFHTIKRNPLYLTFITVIAGLITIACNYYMIVILKMGYMGWFWSAFLSSVVTAILYAYPVLFQLKLRPVFWKNKKFFRNQMKVSLPMIPHTYSSYLLNSSDRMVMSVLGIDINKIGVYSLASTFGSYSEVVGNALGLAVGPYINDMLAKKDAETEKKLRSFIFFLQAIFLAGTTLLCLWLKEVFDLLIRNEALKSGYALAIVIIMGYCYRPMYWACINRLIFNKLTSKLWRISFVAGLVNVGLNFIFIPIFGYSAAAYNTFIALLYVGFSGFFINDYKKLNVINYRPWSWIAAIAGCSVLVYLLKDIPVSLKVIITGIAVPVSAFYFYRMSHQLKNI